MSRIALGVRPARHESLLRQRGCVVWITGLSGSGKSTLASGLAERLARDGYVAFVLDGDNIRRGLNCDLGFSRPDRDENIRRIAEVANLFADCGVICITAFISPFRAARARARAVIGPGRFFEIHAAAGLTLCEKRDVKGLYRKARKGSVADFTGVSQIYEVPKKPALRLDTGRKAVEACVEDLVGLLRKRGMLRRIRRGRAASARAPGR
jgi:adenylyl-sulfate kinase